MPASEQKDQGIVFDYRTLRLLVGILAFALPLGAWLFYPFLIPLSISASYYTGARDFFIGSLCVIATLFFAYNGHKSAENWMANLGALTAIVAASVPTSCNTCALSPSSIVHLIAGATLFVVIAYFCLWPFRQSAKDKPDDKAKKRAAIYTICGVVIIVSIPAAGAASFLKISGEFPVIFWAETIAIIAFGIAWIVASKIIPSLADEDERLKVSLDLPQAPLLKILQK